MKYLIFSDLHGSSEMINKIIKIFEEEKCDKMIFLGDLLYHGPRNDIPEGYNPKEVCEVVKKYKDKFIWVRGNCDCRVDEMVTGIKIKNKLRINNMILIHGDLLKNKKSKLFTKIVFYARIS